MLPVWRPAGPPVFDWNVWTAAVRLPTPRTDSYASRGSAEHARTSSHPGHPGPVQPFLYCMYISKTSITMTISCIKNQWCINNWEVYLGSRFSAKIIPHKTNTVNIIFYFLVGQCFVCYDWSLQISMEPIILSMHIHGK